MKRVIKFRGMQLDNGKWLVGDLIRMGGITFIFPDPAPDGFDRYMVDPATVGQFTGLKDKNGVEIYEGDILTDAWDFVGRIAWDSICACFFIGEFDDNSEEGEYFNLVAKGGIITEREVIGNIHDNPELPKTE